MSTQVTITDIKNAARYCLQVARKANIDVALEQTASVSVFTQAQVLEELVEFWLEPDQGD